GERIAALRLARHAYPCGQVGDQGGGELEQASRIALREFELDLGDRHMLAPRANLAHVEAERGLRSVREGEGLSAALDVGSEHWPATTHVLGEEFAPGSVSELVRVHAWLRERPFEFGALVHARSGAAVTLDRLQPAVAGAPHAQRDACSGKLSRR